MQRNSRFCSIQFRCYKLHLQNVIRNYVTPCSWVRLEKPPVAQLLGNFTIFDGTRTFITILAATIQWPITVTGLIKSVPPHVYHCNKRNPWPESESELYRPRDRLLSAKLVTTFADRGCQVVSVTDPYCRILGFLDRSSHFFFQVAPLWYSRGWVGPVPDPLLLRKSSSAGNRTRTSGSVARNFHH
jgi:hypothetical protein